MLDFRTEQHQACGPATAAHGSLTPDLLSALGNGEDVTLTHLQELQNMGNAFVVQLSNVSIRQAVGWCAPY